VIAREQFPDFAVACGEEASDPVVLHEGRPVRVDELARSGHLGHQDDDLAAVAALGVRWWRYGMPWRLVETEPGAYDWSLWDRALAACEFHGLEPIVDLCHFGLPDHYEGFCEPAWVDGFLRYVDAFLARYPAPRFFTPVNEPAITARCAALWGIWNDRRASFTDYANALALAVLADVEAIARIDADRAGWWIGAEGFGCHVAATPDDEPAAAEARALDQLVWDLRFGVDPDPLVARLLDNVDARVLARIVDHRVGYERAIAGHDVYPVSIEVHGATRSPTIEERVAAYDAEARRWHARYGRAFWIAETSNLGLSVDDGPRWLDALVAGVDGLRAGGLPVRGICWYSRGDQYDWDTMLTRPIGEVTEVGLFDANRQRRAVADSYAALARRD
jgi:hypothetical protein